MDKCASLMSELKEKNHEIEHLNQKLASMQFGNILENAQEVAGLKVVSAMITDAKSEILRNMGDKLKEQEPNVSRHFGRRQSGALYHALRLR